MLLPAVFAAVTGASDRSLISLPECVGTGGARVKTKVTVLGSSIKDRASLLTAPTSIKGD